MLLSLVSGRGLLFAYRRLRLGKSCMKNYQMMFWPPFSPNPEPLDFLNLGVL
jgi:hypothetical protein